MQWRWDCEQTSQIWAHCADITILPVPYNMYSVAMAWNGWKCLNLVDGNTTNGNRVNVWDCNGQDDQKWIWKNGNFVFKKDQTKCLDVPGGNFAAGQPIGYGIAMGEMGNHSAMGMNSVMAVSASTVEMVQFVWTSQVETRPTTTLSSCGIAMGRISKCG